MGLSGGPKPKKWNASLGPGALRNAGGVDYYAFGVARNGPKLVMVKYSREAESSNYLDQNPRNGTLA